MRAILAPAVLLLASLAPAASAQLALNEIRPRPSGGPHEFVELVGPPGASLDGHLILGVDGGGPATLFLALDLTGHVVPPDGYLVAGGSAVPGADLALPGAGVLVDGTQTLYLVETDDVAALLALVGGDVDPDGDRVTVIPELARIRDVVALGDEDYIDGDERVYDGAPTLVSGASVAPPGIFRGGDAPGAWCDRYLDLLLLGNNTDFEATPGAPNIACPTYAPHMLELRAESGEPGDRFGSSVAVDGARAVVGALGDDEVGPDSGAAYVFDLTTGEQTARLLPPGPSDFPGFGAGVAIEGDLVVVARGVGGVVSVFDAGTGIQLATLTHGAGGLGSAVAIEDGLALVGAPGLDAVIVFDAAAGHQVARLSAGTDSDSFGASLAVDGGVVLIGAPHGGQPSQGGAAYLFDLATGTQLHELLPSDPAQFGRFGVAVDLQGDLAIVASERGSSQEPIGTGEVYVFDVGTGAELAKLRPGDWSDGDAFGQALAMGAGFSVVGAPGDLDGAYQGTVYLLDPLTGEELARLAPAGRTPGDAGLGLAGSLAADDSTVLAAATRVDADTGAVYVFRRPLGSGFCAAAPNSVSPGGARLWAVGSEQLSAGNLTLLAEGVPPQAGLFFFGGARTQVPFGDGFRCVGGALRRLPVAQAMQGVLRTELDFELYGDELAALGTVHFQGWYRDPVANGAGFNLTDARTIVFAP